MATDISDVIALLSDDLLCCEICTREFNVDLRPPLVLPCYHSFCRECVEELGREGSLKCPKCGQVAPSPPPPSAAMAPGSPAAAAAAAAGKGFPVDVTRVTLMDLRQALQSQVDVACDSCSPLGGARAVSLCQDCAEYLCQSCTQQHRAVGMSPQHTVVSLSQAVLSAELLTQTGGDRCERHDEEKLKLFCMTCSEALCSMCALSLHLEGHKFMELQSVVGDRKAKVLALCQQLDQAQSSFQERAGQWEAGLLELEVRQREAEGQLQDAFLCILSTAQQRQQQLLEELHTKVNADRLLMEAQLANFRGLQAASQAAADYGRRLVSLSLLSQILSQSADLERLAANVKERLLVSVVPMPVYKVCTEGLEELHTLVKSLGSIERGVASDAAGATGAASAAAGTSAAAAAAADVDAEKLPVTFPDIRLDTSCCNRDCTVSADGCSLINQPHPPSSPTQPHPPSSPTQPHPPSSPPQPHPPSHPPQPHPPSHHPQPHPPSSPSPAPQEFPFRGTSSRAALPGGQTCYWQVRCRAQPSPDLAAEEWLCEVGVASLGALHAGGEWIASPGSRALTVVLRPSRRGRLHAWVCYNGLQVVDAELAPFHPSRPVDCTLGFLFHQPSSRLAVLLVEGEGGGEGEGGVPPPRLLLEVSQVDGSQPLWPCLSAYNAACRTRASTCLTVQSGPGLSLAPPLLALIDALLQSFV